MKTNQEVCIPVGTTVDGETIYYILNPTVRALDCLVSGQKVGFNGFTGKEQGIKKLTDTKLQKLVWHIDDVDDWADMFYKRRMDIKPELMTGTSTLVVDDLIKQAKPKTDNLDKAQMSRRDARKAGQSKPSKAIGFQKL